MASHEQPTLAGDTSGPPSVGAWPAILTLVLFFVSNLAVIFPLRLPIPPFLLQAAYDLLVLLRVSPVTRTKSKQRHLHLNFITVPLISVLILLATRAFTGQTVRDGIVGTHGIQPLNIMALFISLAYISISLDATGLFRFLAFWVARKGGSSGRRLFAYLYVFFLLCGVVVGNDPVILSGTAFLAYFTRVAGITPPTAWIFSQFAAANLASVVLVSSNPTNLVLSGAFSVSFLSYAAHVVLPFLAAATLVFPLLLFLFLSPFSTCLASRDSGHTLIPAQIDIGLTDAEVRATLVDARGAVFGSTLLVVTLGVLVGVSTIEVPVWMVTVPPAVIMLGRDVWYDWVTYHGKDKGMRPAASDPTVGENSLEERGVAAVKPIPTCTAAQAEVDETSISSRPASVYELQDLRSRHSPTITHTTLPTPLSLSSASTPPYRPLHTALIPALERALDGLTSRFPTVTHVIERLPIALLPFAFLMFILVQGLTTKGWVELFARWWAAWVGRTGVLGAVGGMGFLACALCNFCGTNIGATILLARVLQLWVSPTQTQTLMSSQSAQTIDPRARDGALYALALGSNFGAFTLTFSASLAGLLWRDILRQKGIRVRGRQFLLVNLPISAVAMLVGCGVLVAQVYIEHREG